MAGAGHTEDQGPFTFGEKILNLLDQGRFTSTYKYAVLLSMVDLCLENPKPDGSAPDILTTAQIAEKIVEVYWPHTSPFAGESKTKILAQNTGGQAEIVSAITRFRASHKADPSEPISRARARNPRRFEALLRFVEWKLIEMPLPKLQRVGDTEDSFLYETAWKGDARQRDVGKPGFDGSIRLVGRSGDYLVELAGLLRPLIQRQWSRMVAGMNRDVIDDSRVEEFLFGAQRIPTDPVRESLRDIQNNRCFYCKKPIGKEADVDHFLPWARHPDNGIENLVITDQRCNNDKRDFLAAAEHVERWRESRFGGAASQLADIAKSTNWETHPQRTFGAVRSIYLRMPSEQKLWLRGRDFVNADRSVLAAALGSMSVDQ
jgi:HNH endonuclease